MNINDVITESQHKCPHCGGPLVEYSELGEGKKDTCYYKVKASAKVWPSAYASGRLVQCRKKGAGNYGKSKTEGVAEGSDRIAANKQDRLEALENKLKAKGYTRTKDPSRREYQYRWTRDGAPSYVVNYRFGNNGYAEFWKEQGVAEGINQQLSVQQLATIGDEALDNAYHYGRSSPGNTFGWQANLKSAAYAKQMIDQGVTDIEAISDAIHQGWNTTAQAFVQNPKQFDDTEKLRAAGKLEAKLQQRAKLMNIDYDQLPDDEQEKDRVVARALLQALTGQQDAATDNKQLDELSPAAGWSQKYKSSINCSHPKGFSQKAHCAGKKKHNESIEMEMVCEDCGMCETHSDHSRDNLDEACGQDALARILELGGSQLTEQLSADQQFDMIEEMVEQLAEQHGVDADEIWEDFESVDDHELLDESAAWHRKAGKSKSGGLNAKGVASYRRENPGSKLQTAVTTKPSKLKAGSKAAKRRKSFCARMGGVKGPMKKPNGKPTRKALALRKWNC